MKSAAAGYYAMFAPESVGGGDLGIRAMVFVEGRCTGSTVPAARSSPGPRFPQPADDRLFVDGPSHMLVPVSDTVRKENLPRISG